MLARTWSNWNSHALLMEMQSGTATLENDGAVSYKVKYILYHLAIPLQVIYPKEMKTRLQKSYKQMFIATSFTIIKV